VIGEDMVYSIKARCLKWKSVSQVLLDCMSMKLKRKFYRTENLQYMDQNPQSRNNIHKKWV